MNLVTLGALASAVSAPVLVQEHAAGGEFHPVLPGLIVLLPLLGFVLNGVLALTHGARSADAVRAGGELDLSDRPATHRWPTWIGPGVMLVAFALTCVNFFGLMSSGAHEPAIVHYWTWMATGTFTVDWALQIDALSLVMMMIITGVGFLIHVFSVGYMQDDAGYPRYFAYLNLFVFFMLVLVMGASFPVMFVGWEGVGLCSYLLIGYWFSDREKSDAGKKAFIVNRIGDFGFLVALFLLYSAFGTLNYVEIFESAPAELVYGGGLATAITLFFLLGAAGKSAQVPLYVWLPDAMAGPTPVSALIHAATMVTAGVYMVARSSVLFALSPVGSATVAGIGVLTALFAATIALVQTDIKRVLAYSTVSQLGYMFLGVGVGAYAAGVFHLMTHAFFKALLFLGSGAVIHAMHHALHHTHNDADPQDMRNMGGLKRFMPLTWITMWIATLAIAGVWPFAGFFSKDEIIWYTGAWAGAENAPFAGLYTVYWIMALAAAMLTAFYMTRLMVMTFHGENRTGEEEAKHLHKAPMVMAIPLGVLAVLSVIGGWFNIPEELTHNWMGFLGLIPAEGLHHWLEPVTAVAHEIQVEHMGDAAHVAPFGGGEVLWALLSTVAAVLVVVVTARTLASRTVPTEAEEGVPTGGIRGLLYQKWYVDELYDAVIVKPIVRASRFCWRVIDQVLIDGLVNLTGGVAWLTGFFATNFQTGRVNTYAFIFTLGVLCVLGLVVF